MEQVEEQGATIFRLTKQEVLELCKPGAGSDTCIWLLVGPKGFDCHYFARPSALCRRWTDGETVAKRNGCELVKSKNVSMKQVEAESLADIEDAHKRIGKFHAHLDICEQCERHPFDLCPEGARLLKYAATGRL